MENNKRILYLVILIALITITVGLATYAYFVSSSNTDQNAPLNVTTANRSAFTASSDGEIVLDVTFDKMTEANVSTNIAVTDNATVTVTLDSENENSVMTCTYDIVWVWDSDNKYTEADEALPYKKDEIEYPYELSTKIDGTDEKDLSKFTWNTVEGKTEAIIGSKSISVTGKGSITNNHKVEVQVYNIPVDQQKLFNKSFKAHLEVKNNICSSSEREFPTMAKYITDTVYIEDGEGGIYFHDGVGAHTNANLEASIKIIGKKAL